MKEAEGREAGGERVWMQAAWACATATPLPSQGPSQP